MSERESTQVDNYLKWFKNHRVFSIVLLAVAVTIGLASFTGAISKIADFAGSVFSADDFPDKLSDAKSAYAGENFNLAIKLFGDLENRANEEATYRDDLEDLSNALSASKAMMEALAKHKAFLNEKDPEERERLELESANAWDQANRIYPYGVRHEVLNANK